MPTIETVVHHYYEYHPPGVKKVLGIGTSAWVGLVDETTVFKYPLAPGGDMSRLEVERQLLELVGRHERVIQLKGSNEKGIYLERAPNGTLGDFLVEILSKQESHSLLTTQRVAWCRETIEAVAHVHSRHVLHCDIQPYNLLLDTALHVKLTDFQGKHLAVDDTILLDGFSSEPTRFSYPRDDPHEADIKTDLSALGCTIYFIMMGHAVYPDIVDGSDEWDERVQERFAKQQFPEDLHACMSITQKCWRREYESAEEVLRDIVAIEKTLISIPL
jgi:serine/threonine protein kinase